MNWSAKRNVVTASAGLAVTLMIAWGVMSFAYAYNSRLARMNDSFNRGMTAVTLLDQMNSSLDRLSVDQQASLSTGAARFNDAVWQSIVGVEENIGWLNEAAGKAGVPHAEVARLTAAVNQALEVIARSDDIREAKGKAAALRFLDANEAAFSEVKSQAGQMRNLVLQNISGDVRQGPARRDLIGALFEGTPRRITLAHGIAGLSSGHAIVAD